MNFSVLVIATSTLFILVSSTEKKCKLSTKDFISNKHYVEFYVNGECVPKENGSEKICGKFELNGYLSEPAVIRYARLKALIEAKLYDQSGNLIGEISKQASSKFFIWHPIKTDANKTIGRAKINC